MADHEPPAVQQPDKRDESPPDRRGFLSTIGMLSGLAAGYGAFIAMAGRFLFPARPAQREWMFVTTLDEISPGASITYRSPQGLDIAVTRRNDGKSAKAFVALSSICPHLGCRVHWEPQNERFFCPCHNGAFNAEGAGTEGPPKDASQELAKFELKVEKKSLLYIKVPVETEVA